MNVSEDLLNRQTQDYGLVCPQRARNLVWSYFKKYGSKNLTRGHDNVRLQQEDLCTICLGDQDRRRLSTVQLGKDNSPSAMLDHLRIHHREEHDTVVVDNSKGLTLAAFNEQRNGARVRTLLGNSTVRESTDISPVTGDATPKAGNTTGDCDKARCHTSTISETFFTGSWCRWSREVHHGSFQDFVELDRKAG